MRAVDGVLLCGPELIHQDRLSLMSFDSPLYRAIAFAVSVHVGQNKKGSGEPFIAHVFSVALRLSLEGADEEVVIAGLLHDALEKTGATYEQISAGFGERVAGIVKTCTEPADIPSWPERKGRLLNAFRQAPPDAQMVMVADKLYNLVSFTRLYRSHGEKIWSLYDEGRENRIWYLTRIKEIAEEAEQKAPRHSLFREYIQKYNESMEELNASGEHQP